MLGYDALQIGLAFLPVTIVMGTLSLRYSERLITRFGARTMLFPGLALIVAGLVLFAQAPVDGNYVRDVLPVMVLLGAGAGVCFPAADDAGDVRRDAERRGPGLRPGQHDRAGRRRAGPGRAGDAVGLAHRPPGARAATATRRR